MSLSVDISFGVGEILDLISMPKSQIVKALLNRVKYYTNQDGEPEASSSHSSSESKPKDETAIDQATKHILNPIPNKHGMRPN